MNNRLLFLGPPGAGKGTQAIRLCDSKDLMHLSTGDLLRAEVAAGTEFGLEAAAVMNRGELVSDSLVLGIVQRKLINQSKGWLLDGFPRNLAQAKALNPLLEKIKQPIQAVILLEIDDELLVRRLLSRGRDDDNEPVIRNRLEVYKEKTAPLVNHYQDKGLLRAIKADGTIDEVAERIEQIIS